MPCILSISGEVRLFLACLPQTMAMWEKITRCMSNSYSTSALEGGLSYMPCNSWNSNLISDPKGSLWDFQFHVVAWLHIWQYIVQSIANHLVKNGSSQRSQVHWLVVEPSECGLSSPVCCLHYISSAYSSHFWCLRGGSSGWLCLENVRINICSTENLLQPPGDGSCCDCLVRSLHYFVRLDTIPYSGKFSMVQFFA